jgi:hypothetical protein
MTGLASPFFLSYKQNKGNNQDAAAAPIVAGAKGPQNGGAYAIGGWEDDWTQLSSFNFGGKPYLLLYK